MLGINDPQVVLAYVLCIGATLFAVVYSALNWNKGDEAVHPEDRQWVEQEKSVESEL